MLLKVNLQTKSAERIRGVSLNTFGIDERAFQEILYLSLDRLIPDDELLVFMQSRRWQEEPDLMAIDKEGRLFIFELKAWEARSENLLQVLRYGQLYGIYKYDDLDHFYRKFENEYKSLKEAHHALFGVDLSEEQFNRKQVFVVVTNGIDYKTREAIQYWRSQKIDVRPWIYRVYKGENSEMLLEMSAFSSTDNPYEDIAEGYYILNTNIRNSQEDHDSMLADQKAAAYFTPWKYKIQHLSKRDIVFLYQSGVGTVAVGTASGKLQMCSYHRNPEHENEEYFMKLTQFHLLSQPISAAEIKTITSVNHRFMGTMFGLDSQNGKKLYDEAIKR